MYNEKNILGIIPVRGGSKGIPNKNIKPLAGKPLIAYTIESALKIKSFDRIIVSTDSPRIKKISQRYGAEVPFLRPECLAKDDTPMISVLKHAIGFLEQRENFFPHIIVLLQPTSPLRTSSYIKEALEKFFNVEADSVVSLCEVKDSPYWMKKLVRGRVVSFMQDRGYYTRRQDLPKVYRLNGAIYITRRDVIMKENRILGRDTRAIIMNQESSVDIDSEPDFQLAEWTLKKRLCTR